MQPGTSSQQSANKSRDGRVRCALCGRYVPPHVTSEHHLRPRSRGGTAEDAVTLCSLCHSFIHATFTNRTLARCFDSLQSLREDQEVRNFLRWARKQKPHRRISVERRQEKR